MKTILLPTDFSENAKNASRYAFSMFNDDEHYRFLLVNTFAMPYSASEVIVSVNDIIEQDSRKGLENEISQLKKPFKNLESTLEGVSTQGETVSEIEKVAKNQSADYIVMGTKGSSGLMEVFVGSVTSSVLKNVATPVLVIPEGVEFVAPKNIVFAADYMSLKDVSELAPLKEIALKFNSTITMLNVLKKDELTDADEAIEGLKLNAYFQGVPLEYAFLENDDIEAGIAEYVSNNSVDMLAMIERKVSFFERLFHKSITKQVANHIKLPLLVLHDEEK